ncbi:hypothetical protein N7516_001304 [Penicillium verrucosum]|uniref:uncharacterized protein n=1 Tax=Penicillium verrucosum TaxID=60171 RepID=UPI002545229B|nr:uncharacterized protein N7516_001304 [Penicillium verrucosum]KAJ5941136.1 hypothetical protein N7516_001304 [Penicillium verrucosum]
MSSQSLCGMMSLTETDAREIAQSLLPILLEYEHLQVLWNIKNQMETHQNEDVHSVIDTISHLSHNRTRKLQLNVADIASLLAGEAISCIVHRGEAGLFHDALTSGVPQLLLPKWERNYDYAVQAEWLGVRKWANRAHSPLIANGELTAALRNILNQQGEGVRISQQAKEFLEKNLMTVLGEKVSRDRRLGSDDTAIVVSVNDQT